MTRDILPVVFKMGDSRRSGVRTLFGPEIFLMTHVRKFFPGYFFSISDLLVVSS